MATDYIRNGNRAIKQNIWDNWYGYEGVRRVVAFANSAVETQEQQARAWLQEDRRVAGLIVPTVHLNGTGREDLTHDWLVALKGVQRAIAALEIATPHGRDYYPQGEQAYPVARQQHEARIKALEQVEREVAVILETVSDKEQ